MDSRGKSPETPYAPFACRPEESRGRLFKEDESPTRSCFQRDRDRIIHSSVFRRLMHKTQVFVYHEGDYFRTRLTHSLEVAQIARTLARSLGLDEDLAEALALAHDLGHPPFGHAGEEVLQDCMADFGGFDHNAYSLRHITELEQRYADFDGLNLTWETLEGIVKHNGPLVTGATTLIDLPEAITSFNAKWDLELKHYASVEAQVAALADDIAYNNHDLDDGLRAGLFTFEAIESLSILEPFAREVKGKYPGLTGKRLRHETIRRLFSYMVGDLLAETRKRIEKIRPDSATAVRALDGPLVAFSADFKKADRELRDFLFHNMYRHFRVNRSISKAKRVVSDLFQLFLTEPGVLPSDWQASCEGPGTEVTARVVCDYIAGMTDRYALLEHRRLFQVDPLV